MTEKLTLEDCFKYPKASLINPLGLKTKSVIELIIYCYNANITINELIKIDNLKLILRSIEQLTDEEKKHIVENFLCFQENYKTFSCGVEYLFNCSFNETTNYSVELADYLRKKNIMIENPNWFEIRKGGKG